MAALCEAECHPSMAQSCGGRVLRCLTEKQDSLTSQECKDEVFYFEKMEVNDYRNDVILAEACRTDVDKLCKSVPKGALGDHVISALHSECGLGNLGFYVGARRAHAGASHACMHGCCIDHAAVEVKCHSPVQGKG